MTVELTGSCWKCMFAMKMRHHMTHMTSLLFWSTFSWWMLESHGKSKCKASQTKKNTSTDRAAKPIACQIALLAFVKANLLQIESNRTHNNSDNLNTMFGSSTRCHWLLQSFIFPSKSLKCLQDYDQLWHWADKPSHSRTGARFAELQRVTSNSSIFILYSMT